MRRPPIRADSRRSLQNQSKDAFQERPGSGAEKALNNQCAAIREGEGCSVHRDVIGGALRGFLGERRTTRRLGGRGAELVQGNGRARPGRAVETDGRAGRDKLHTSSPSIPLFFAAYTDLSLRMCMIFVPSPSVSLKVAQSGPSSARSNSNSVNSIPKSLRRTVGSRSSSHLAAMIKTVSIYLKLLASASVVAAQSMQPCDRRGAGGREDASRRGAEATVQRKFKAPSVPTTHVMNSTPFPGEHRALSDPHLFHHPCIWFPPMNQIP
ncbi:hypothetical protein BDK51DRAFT_49468 [Blyttiomyces helicus]|uniref:Uncharacterized protein n=1 Tax=Blyttiomyces helicus TaxID=388810 RepID=A0A4P9VU40_9FUNG|nr:hypothetical protein BDK51DRAFT_49468 [Blyttiomyces helicus]|eukprot:RKO83074.1 hypothetical protein BDK51DRAFT_49468 [Blyttiomyces helicus]